MTTEPTITANTCIECGLEWDDHTITAFRDHWTATHPPLDMPYAPTTSGPTTIAVSAIADHVTVGGAAIGIPHPAQLAGLPPALPALQFRFHRGLEPVAEVTLVLGEEQIRALRTLVGDAIDGSLRAARKARR